MIPLAALCVLLIAVMQYERVNSRRERETMLKAVNLAIAEGTKERESARLERQELANRIQRPEATPVYSVPDDEPQSITYDSDKEFWEAKNNGVAE